MLCLPSEGSGRILNKDRESIFRQQDFEHGFQKLGATFIKLIFSCLCEKVSH